MADLKALLQDRKTKQGGRILKRYLCLDTALLERRDDLTAERDSLPDSDGPRMAGDSRRAQIDHDLAQLEQDMAAATVQLVFRSLTFAAYETLFDTCQKTVDTGNGETEKRLDADRFFPELARRCFVEFRQNGETVSDLTADDFADLLDTLPHGEADMLFFALRGLHMGEDALPKSVTRSVATRG